MIGQNSPDLMLARKQLEQGGVMSPGLRLRLVGQGLDPSSIEAEASQGALSAGGPGAGPDTQGALPTAAPTSEGQPLHQQPERGSINRSPGAPPPDWAPPEGQGVPVPREPRRRGPQAPEGFNLQPPALEQPTAGALGSPAASPAGPEPATSPAAAPGGPAAAPAEEAQAAPPDAQQIAERVQRAPDEQKAEITKQLQNKGIDVEKAYTEWMEKLGGEAAPNLKLTKQEKGLFLLEFGLRMMSASARTGALDALGQAGAGTLASYQGEMDRRRGEATAQSERAQEGALALTGMEIDAQAKGPRGNDVLADDAGNAFFVGPNGEPVFLTDEEGNRVKLDPNMRGRYGSGGGPSVFQQKVDAFLNYKSQGDPSKITHEMRMDALAYAGSGMTSEQLRYEATLRAEQAQRDMMKALVNVTPPGEKEPKFTMDWTQQNWNDWTDQYVETLIRRARGETLSAQQARLLREAEAMSGGREAPNPSSILGDDDE